MFFSGAGLRTRLQPPGKRAAMQPDTPGSRVFLPAFSRRGVDKQTENSYTVSIFGNLLTMKQSESNRSVQHKIFEMQCEICKALANPVRMAIVNSLKDKETAAADLIAELEISKVNLSKHIALLVHAGIVEQRREGRQILYRLTDPEIQQACSIMSSVIYRRLKRGEKLASAINLIKVS